MVQPINKYSTKAIFMFGFSWWQGAALLCLKGWFTKLTPVHNKSLNVDCHVDAVFPQVRCAAS